MSRAKPTASVLCVLIFLIAQPVRAQEGAADVSTVVIPANTAVKLQFAKTISSATVRRGDRLDFVVKQDVTVEGFTVVQAGALGQGSVVGVKSKRLLGIGGHLVVQLDSLKLADGTSVDLVAQKRFKGASHTLRMGLAMAAASAIYLPAAPVFLLLRGRDSTVLMGTEITAFTRSDTWIEPPRSQQTRFGAAAVTEMLSLLPPRAMNGEGREGDMLNLIFIAKENDLQNIFAQAGWVKVEESKPRIIWHLLVQRKHYARLPMDRLYVFGKSQDYSYALPDPNFLVARRHHLRIWRTDRTVGGVPLWVAAATHDVAIEFVTRKLWVFHKIDPNVRLLSGTSSPKTCRRPRNLCARSTSIAPNLWWVRKRRRGRPFYSDNRLLLIGLNGGVAPSAASR